MEEIAATTDPKISRQRVQQILSTVELDLHYGQRRREERVTRLKDAHARLCARESTVAEEAERLGYKTTQALLNALWRLGLTRPPVEPPAHGTYYRYNHYRCRCDECRKAAREHHLARIKRGPKKHGTASAYRNFGCRCAKCTKAERKYQRDRIAKKRQQKEPIG